ncbi:MAG: hypothetical protein JNL21_10755 [Myxococcales bacterium]|nr:hypothetical protein [Myxococcales bacterium]
MDHRKGEALVRRAGLALALSLAAVGANGCAEEREPINRVQPNALAKSFFIGEDFVDTGDDPAFYARAVITDVGYGAAQDALFTSTYAQPVSVIKWEVTEDLLIGRIVYNRIIGADSEGDGPSSIDGTVAYAFPILTHFDIRRDYNPSTGEETNVIVENSSDRPWDQREYFRVDWSRNLNTDAYDFDTLSLVGVYGAVTYEPLSYYVNDPKHPDAPHFATKEGYFDITTKAFATPGLIDLSHLGWGIDSFPACYLPNDLFGGSYPFGNCNPVELTLRMSFRRADPSDYAPLDIDGNRFAAFGAFYGERFGYARNYGITDNKWHRLAARFNIWEWHHAYQDDGDTAPGAGCAEGWVESKKFPGKCEVACYTSATPVDKEPTRDENQDGTDDECNAVTPVFGAGSRCDKLEQKCTLPYYARKEKPIVWHYSHGSSPDYFEGSEAAAHEWDVAMRTAVQAAKYSDCIGVGAPAASCIEQFPMYRGQQEENEDAMALSKEVDDCRHARGAWAQDDGASPPWSPSRLEYCKAQADAIGAARKYSAGVIAIAKMDEMITLCHSPVELGDSPKCVEDHQKFIPAAERNADTREVLPAGVTAAMCDAQFEKRFDAPNEVDEVLLATCDAGFSVRMGDLRYHQINVIPHPQTPSPWGIMVDADDPRTGEKIQSSSNVWAHVNDLASQGLVDTLRYIAGEIPTEEVTNGQYVRDWAAAADAAGGRGALGTMDRATLQKRLVGAVDGRSLESGESLVDSRVLEDPRGIGAVDPIKARAIKDKATKMLASVKFDASAASYNRPFTEARRLAAQGSDTEAALVTQGMMQLAGLTKAEIKQAGDELAAGKMGTSPLLASASALRGLNPAIWRDLRQARELGLAARGACMLGSDEIMAPAPNSLAYLTKIAERKFGKFNAKDDKKVQLERAEKMRKYFANKFQYAVMAHEMGHSIALRHNFVSSSFAYAYRPQYWQLRTKDGTVTEPCTDVSESGEECIGPRYFDPPTQEEQDGLIWMFSHSSVMDYPGELTQDMIGLGIYDFAAARFFYGDVMSVYNDGAEYNISNNRVSQTLLNITGNFGGILGWDYVDRGGGQIHYTQVQEILKVIKPETCAAVDANAFRPKSYDESRHGAFDPLVDALIVTVGGKTTRCKQPEVDYIQYDQTRAATLDESENAGFYDNITRAVDTRSGRIRAPYGFATDSWADLGNLAVYRHDNGADAYELFNFLITEQEMRHIFDNYRRSRTSFSIRSQSQRILGRYNEKMRDGAKGLGLISNIFKSLLAEGGENFDTNWAIYANLFYRDNILASGIAFDHFTRQFMRPNTGPHTYFDTNNPARPVLRALDSSFSGAPPDPLMFVFDGATGYFDNIAIGGKLVANELAEGEGEFDRDYTNNVGSYYDKVFAPYLLTESVDNFISDSLTDFTDPRYRSVSMADLFPDGYRRFLANQLTGDEYIKGARVASQNGQPLVDSDLYPQGGIGWVSWWTPQVEACFPAPGRLVCSAYGCPSGNICDVDDQGQFTPHPLNPDAPAETVAIDPQVEWEEFKWLIAQTLLYLPENSKTNWINLMGIWELGADNDPGFANRIELHLPEGRVYIARTYGTEEIWGKTVQRGVGARMLEYANELMFKAYECNTVTSPESGATWCDPILENGKPKIKFDPGISGTTTCNANNNSGCTCAANRACLELADYESVPAFMRQAMRDFRMADASMQGIYD